MATKTGLRAFISALAVQWVAVMTSSLLAVIFGALAVFGNNPTWITVVWVLLAFLALLVGSYLVWRVERLKVIELEEKTRPIIDVFVDPETKGVRFVDTEVFDPNQPFMPARDGPGSLWLQLMVKSKTAAPLYDCEVRALSLTSKSGNISITEPLWCQWSNGPPSGQTAMLIPAGIAQPANLMAFDHHASRLGIQLTPPKAMLDRKIQNPNVFKFKIAASARNAATEYRNVEITWDGTPDNLKIEIV